MYDFCFSPIYAGLLALGKRIYFVSVKEQQQHLLCLAHHSVSLAGVASTCRRSCWLGKQRQVSKWCIRLSHFISRCKAHTSYQYPAAGVSTPGL